MSDAIPVRYFNCGMHASHHIGIVGFKPEAPVHVGGHGQQQQQPCELDRAWGRRKHGAVREFASKVLSSAPLLKLQYRSPSPHPCAAVACCSVFASYIFYLTGQVFP